MQIARIQDLDSLLPRNRCYVAGCNFHKEDLRASFVAARPTHENLYGIYLSKPEGAWSAIWRAVLVPEALGERRIEYFPPDAKQGDLVGRIGIRSPIEEKISLASPAYLYFYDFDPKGVDGLTMVDLSQWCPNGKHKSLEGLGFVRRERDGRIVLTVDYDHPMLVKVDEWQYVAVNLDLRPTVLAELTTSFVEELSRRVINLTQGPALSPNQSDDVVNSRPAA